MVVVRRHKTSFRHRRAHVVAVLFVVTSAASAVGCTSPAPDSMPRANDPMTTKSAPTTAKSTSPTPVAVTAPPACVVTLKGVWSESRILSGSEKTTLNVPAGATIHIRGTVTDITNPPGSPLVWSLSPLTSGTTPAAGTTEVDTTWTASDKQEHLDVELHAPGDESHTYRWDLQLSTDAPGCLPATPQACIQAGGNLFYADATMVDGQRHKGCFAPKSCISDIPVRLESIVCGPDDMLVKTRAVRPTYVAIIDGNTIAVAERHRSSIKVGSPYGHGVVAATQNVVISGVPYLLVIPTTTEQGTRAIEADPGLVQDVLKRNPHLAEDNPGFSPP